MFNTTDHSAHMLGGIKEASWNSEGSASTVEEVFPEGHEVLAVALDFLDRGKAEEADALLTAAALKNPDDERLWLAAGICRMRRGAIRSAAVAFEMAAWLSDDGDARELRDLCSIF